jgi:hypothetical protein
VELSLLEFCCAISMVAYPFGDSSDDRFSNSFPAASPQWLTQKSRVLEFGSRASSFSAAHRIVRALEYLGDDAKA